MARSINLKEYQQRLITRMMASRERSSDKTRLGFQVGSIRCLLKLEEAEQVLPVPVICPAPLTKPWFRGLVEVRGDVYGVVDFADFLGQRAVSSNPNTRLIVIGRKLGNPSVLMVEQVLGIRHIQKYQAQEKPAAYDFPWFSSCLLDEEQNQWLELDIARLISDPQFADAQL